MILRRPITSRFLAALLGSWFVLLVTEPVAAMHRCPMHDGFVQAGAHHSSGHDAHHEAPAHTNHSCSCIGECSAAGLQFTLPAISGLSTKSAVRAYSSGMFYDDAVRSAEMDHLRPYPTAPPVKASI